MDFRIFKSFHFNQTLFHNQASTVVLKYLASSLSIVQWAIGITLSRDTISHHAVRQMNLSMTKDDNCPITEVSFSFGLYASLHNPLTKWGQSVDSPLY